MNMFSLAVGANGNEKFHRQTKLGLHSPVRGEQLMMMRQVIDDGQFLDMAKPRRALCK